MTDTRFVSDTGCGRIMRVRWRGKAKANGQLLAHERFVFIKVERESKRDGLLSRVAASATAPRRRGRVLGYGRDSCYGSS